MKMLLVAILLHFSKPKAMNNCNATKELLEINIEDVNNHLPAKIIDFGPSTVEKTSQNLQFRN